MESGNNKVKSNSKKIVLILVGIMLFVMFIFASIAISILIIYNDSIHSGVYVEDIDIGGLTSVEASNKIKADIEGDMINDKLVLRYKDMTWQYTSKDLGLKYDILKAVNDAYLVGRRGTIVGRFETIFDLLRTPHTIALKPQVNDKLIDVLLSEIDVAMKRKPIDAKIRRENAKFKIADEVFGLELDYEKARANIIKSLSEGSFYDLIEVELAFRTVEPRLKSSELKRVKHLLGTHTTSFNSRVAGRTYNIKLASNSINGTVLLPGDVFSFNDIVGPRNEQNGYKTAKVIFKGKLVDGIGGGICQVSSTLYNSVLKSEMGIVRRSNHTIPSTYVPLGLDATVSYGRLDFRFENTTSAPTYLYTNVSGNRITVSVYGEKTTSRYVKLKSQVTDVIRNKIEVIYDDSMFEGVQKIEEKGGKGYKVSTYMHIYEDGKYKSSKLIAKDYYKPRTRIIVKGTKKRMEDLE